MVEASVNGVRAGRAAGMRVIGFSGASHCLDDHVELLQAAGAHTVIDDLASLGAAIHDVRRTLPP